jgi:hypothetical protein
MGSLFNDREGRRCVALNVGQIVSELRRMTVTELRRKYAEVFGEQTRSGHKDYLVRRIAWRVQANAEGGLSDRARRRAMEIARDADLRMRAPGPARAPMSDAAPLGTVVTRRLEVPPDERFLSGSSRACCGLRGNAASPRPIK